MKDNSNSLDEVLGEPVTKGNHHYYRARGLKDRLEAHITKMVEQAREDELDEVMAAVRNMETHGVSYVRQESLYAYGDERLQQLNTSKER